MEVKIEKDNGLLNAIITGRLDTNTAPELEAAVRDEIAPELSETLMNRGKIIFIDKQPDDNYEIWIRDPETNENFAYYLFDYSFGIVDCRENEDE